MGQGWKLHLSATVMSAVDLLEACAQALANSRHQFKIITHLTDVAQLNSGARHGRSQIGKVITIYCPDPQRGRALAEELDRLTKGIPCPEVPSDRRFRKASCVFYRKQCRRVATRYDKLAANYLAFIQLASIRLWVASRR
jgi:class IV lanthipeptide synthase